MTARLLRITAVVDRIGLSKRTLLALVTSGRFPQPVRPTRGTRAWLESEVEAWILARVAERDGKEAA